ncbi:hypothetical protein DFH09DRAFT_1504598 [Mycena vulgaris]|nr:hypothetical protein DFH09DRAFT_1504598 [Mycena vulgaris]
MPSINRLVLLAVLSLSVYVQSAPVPDAAGAALARAIVVTERDVVAVREPEFDNDIKELGARVVDDEDVDEEEDDDDEEVDDDEFDLEEREFDENIGARAVKKAAPKPVKKPAPKKAAPKPVKKLAPKPKPAPKPAPKKAKVPTKPAAKPTTKAPAKAPKPVKKPATKPKPAPKPAPKKAKAPPKPAAKPSAKIKAPAGKPLATTKPATTEPPRATKSAAACAIKKRGEKHFTKGDAPKTLSVEIQGKTFQLKQSSSQGNNAVVYRDAAGDFAKTPLSGTLAKEATFTQEANDACTGTEWMITTAAQGKVFNETPAFIAAKKAGKEECQALAATAAGLAVDKAKSIFDAASTKGVVHGDLNAGNIFFDDDVTQVLTLIDWGSASKKASFPKLVAKGQASTSFNALC